MISKIHNRESISLKRTLFPKTKENEEPNAFVNAILHGISFKKNKKQIFVIKKI